MLRIDVAHCATVTVVLHRTSRWEAVFGPDLLPGLCRDVAQLCLRYASTVDDWVPQPTVYVENNQPAVVAPRAGDWEALLGPDILPWLCPDVSQLCFNYAQHWEPLEMKSDGTIWSVALPFADALGCTNYDVYLEASLFQQVKSIVYELTGGPKKHLDPLWLQQRDTPLCVNHRWYYRLPCLFLVCDPRFWTNAVNIIITFQTQPHSVCLWQTKGPARPLPPIITKWVSSEDVYVKNERIYDMEMFHMYTPLRLVFVCCRGTQVLEPVRDACGVLQHPFRSLSIVCADLGVHIKGDGDFYQTLSAVVWDEPIRGYCYVFEPTPLDTLILHPDLARPSRFRPHVPPKHVWTITVEWDPKYSTDVRLSVFIEAPNELMWNDGMVMHRIAQ